MVYNKFSTGPLDNGYETDYAQQMLQIFSEFKSEAPDAFILDLRYNPGGYLTLCPRTCRQLVGAGIGTRQTVLHHAI